LISTSISRRCSPLIAKPNFIVRADSNPDAASASDEVPETDDEQALESDAEIEELKPPRQTRVKLGDVMGVNYFFHISI
jgi:large subunit ribosomal protein L19